MKKLLQNNLFKIFSLIAIVAASDITWLGTYQAKKPSSLEKK